MKPWKNAGLPWYRRKWEARVGDVHIYAWTEKGIYQKVYDTRVKLQNKRADRDRAV